MPLKYKVFLHSYLGFNSNSTLFYGERDAILVDASQLLSDTHRMVAQIIQMRKNLTHIYVSHFHPDHHFGLSVLQFAFPNAKIVALPSVVKDVAVTSGDKLDMWSIDRFGPADIPKRTTVPLPMQEPRLELEGHELLVSDGWEGDSVNNSVVWVPSIKVVCATDVAFHDCHLWPIESNVARRETMAQGHPPNDGFRPAHRDPRALRRGQAAHPRRGAERPVAHVTRSASTGRCATSTSTRTPTTGPGTAPNCSAR